MTDTDRNITDADAKTVAAAIAANDPKAKLAAGHRQMNATIRGQADRPRRPPLD